jgi:enoyl-CoA hydratase
LNDETLALARTVALKPSVGVKFAKEAVNSSMDAQGFTAALKHAFAIHHLCHAHNRLKYGTLIDPAGVPESVRRSLPDGKLPKLESITVKID